AETASKKAMRLANRVSIAAARDAIERLSFGQARSLLLGVPAHERQWEWHYFWNQLDNSYLSLAGANQRIRQLQFLPAAPALLPTVDATLMRLDPCTRAVTRVLEGADNQDLICVSVREQIATSLDLAFGAAIRNDGDIQLLDMRSGLTRQIKGDGGRKGAIVL